MKASPILKWAGGKRGIIDSLVSSMPSNYGEYWEPFVGGAALFLELQPMDKKAHLSDVNDDLITTYKAVKTSKNKLMKRLDELAESHNEDTYYSIRSETPTDKVERAARFIFINKTGYNGLIRYNSKGELNTPWGHKKNPIKLYDKENIGAFSEALRGVEISTRSYEKIRPKCGDFVYLDPPYYDTYNGYSKDGFGEEGQLNLADFCQRLDDSGVKFMLSNSNTELINKLYSKYRIRKIQAPRLLSCKSRSRKPTLEVLVTNYE